jgi:hypothetical protein
LINASLSSSEATLKAIQTTTKDLSASAGESAPVVDQIGVTIGQNMGDVVRDTQSSLAAAQSSAKLVDDTLKVISAIPLIGQRYAPSQPLSESIGSVSDSLNGLPDAFRKIQDGLHTTAGNLLTVQKEMDQLQTNIDSTESSILAAEQIVGQYQVQIKDLQTQVREFRSELPGWIEMLKWFLTFFFIWMGVEQLALMIQGMEWMRFEKLNPEE